MIAELVRSSDPVTWCFIGDSVTAAQRYTYGARGYVELFHERMRELDRGLDAVINTAVSGWRVTDLLEHLDHIALRHRPDAVVIGIGLNDTKEGAERIPGFEADYARLVARLRDAGAHVVVQTPAGTLPTAPRDVVEHLPAYTEAVRRVAAATGAELVDHDAAWSAENPGVVEEWQGRGCHPNEQGHRAMARTLLRAAGVWDPAASRVSRGDPS